jgi:protein-tyrosine phosphatase
MKDTDDALLGIEVTPEPDGGYRLVWGPAFADGPVDVHAGSAPDELAPAVRGAAPGVRVPVAAGTRPFFRLERADGTGLTVAQRDVPLEGGINFRDLGGYATVDGRRVRWGRLYRSGHLSHLSAAGVARFATLGVATVCDFRMAEERAAEAFELPGAPALEVLGMTPGIGDRFFFHRLFEQSEDPAPVLAAMHDLMADMAINAAPRLQRLFDLLLEAPPGAFLLNCSAGKERTGIAAALVLTALGVPRATVLHDFMLSKRYFPVEAEIPRVLTKYGVKEASAAKVAVVMPLLETHESYLQSAFAAIEARHGSIEAMLGAVYGLGEAELARLRDNYTN